MADSMIHRTSNGEKSFVHDGDRRCSLCPPEETRVVAETGGAKGSKLPQLAWAPPESLLELAKVYGFGVEKYPNEKDESGRERPNYSRGYPWSLNVNALYRHLFAWLSGESTDPETGCNHLAHAAWHCLTLMHFEKKHPAFDDVRWLDTEEKSS